MTNSISIGARLQWYFADSKTPLGALERYFASVDDASARIDADWTKLKAAWGLPKNVTITDS